MEEYSKGEKYWVVLIVTQAQFACSNKMAILGRLAVCYERLPTE